MSKIDSLQVKQDPFYDPGLFRNQRYWITTPFGVEDNNIFFNASLNYLLKTVRPGLSYEQQRLADSVIARGNRIFHKYANRNGDVTYNFWQTTPPDLPFPNDIGFVSKEKYRLPDDFDDTVLAYLAMKRDSTRNRTLRDKILSYSSRSGRKPVPGTMEKYQIFEAYEVLFADKMAQEYDIVVMCNTLLFMIINEYPISPFDQQSALMIAEVLKNNDHLENPELVSPYYADEVLILYHLARTLSVDSNQLLESIRNQVIRDLNEQLSISENEFEVMMIASSLIKLNQHPHRLPNMSEALRQVKDFVFFRFEPKSLLPIGVLPALKWRCEAFNWGLILEYLVLSD